MLEYLDSSFDLSDAESVSVLDEVSLWSAPFGMMLLDHISIKPRMTVLDIGFGTGFPLIELAQRLGNSSIVYGIDPWQEAIDRAKCKRDKYNVQNIRLIEGNAEGISFADNTFDLIVSNVGINNFENPGAVLKECFRVCKTGGQIALTTNPVGHMREFYEVYETTLHKLQLSQYLPDLAKQRDHRLSLEAIGQLLQRAGFRLTSTHQRKFMMRFVDGAAFFNHALIRVGFIEGWKKIIPQQEQVKVFTTLEKTLNNIAHQEGEFHVTVPCLYIEATKMKSSKSYYKN
jgi:arsenite methyltransferase